MEGKMPEFLENKQLADSGERISYGEGMAMREPQSGKGRYDLISPFAMRRIAKHYERGSSKYTVERQIDKGDLISVIKKRVETSLRVPCVVDIDCILWGCAEIAMKKISKEEIKNMLIGSEKTQITGIKTIQSECMPLIKNEKKTQLAESETKRQNEEMLCENVDSQKTRIKYWKNGKIIDVQFAGDDLTKLGQYILTMTIRLEGQEDCYVVDATTESECLKNLLGLCKKLSSTFPIHQRMDSSMKELYVEVVSGDRNWEKGMPFSRYVDSAKRHLDQFVMGMTDEDHLAAACWNLIAIMHHQELGQMELDDMPHYLTK